MKYTVKYYNKYYDQYYKLNSDDKDITSYPIRSTCDTLDGTTIEQCIEFVRDYLDSPDKLMTLDGIKHDFGEDLSDENAEKFVKFYNGRYAIFQCFLKDINSYDGKSELTQRYDIPESHNMFSLEDDESY